MRILFILSASSAGPALISSVYNLVISGILLAMSQNNPPRSESRDVALDDFETNSGLDKSYKMC